MTSLFKLHTLDEHTESLADFLPGGCLFEAARLEGSNLKSTLKGLAGELRRMEDALIQFTDQYDPSTTTSFITEWERMVGIPDDCFPGTGTLAERRIHIVAKSFKSLGAATEQDYIDLAAFLGFAITLSHLPEISFFPPYDVPMDLIYGLPTSRFVLVMTGPGIVVNVPPYDVPFSLTTNTGVISCFFDKLKPANTIILYFNKDPDNNFPPYDVPFSVMSPP